MPSVRIQPGFGGQNSEASPEYVPPTQAVMLENLLPRTGKVVLRGPISTGMDLGVGTYSRLIGAVALGNNIVVYVDDAVDILKEIQSGVPGVYVSATSPGPRYCSLGDFAYAVPYTSAGGLKLVRYDGAATTALADGPADVLDIAVHLNRLFTITLELSGASTQPTNALNWSDAGGPLALAATDWTDDVSGLTNQIIVGESNDRLVALGHVGKQLAIFKDGSIWVLSGLTPASFTLNRITSAWGCLDRESVVDLDDGCFFLSSRGYAYFDGSAVIDVSSDVKSEMLTAIRQSQLTKRGSLGTTVPFARAANIGRDSIMLTIGRTNTSAAVAPIIDFCGIYDVRQRAWSKFSSDAFAVGAPVNFIATSQSSYYAGATLGYDGASNLMYLDDIVIPESASPALGGEDVVDGTTAAINGTSYSRIERLASPGKTAQLKRLLLDYTFVVVSDADPSISGWSVSLVDGLGNVLLAPVSVDATILASGYTADQRRAALVRKRFQVACFADASEVQLRISLPALDSDVTEVIAAEIHDATLEFDAGRPRPTI
jgi:hypothetical protein